MTRQQLKNAKQQLINNGWTYVCGILSDSGKRTGQFGLLFIKDGNKFYLNIDTFNNLPA